MLRYFAIGMAGLILWMSASCTPLIRLFAYNNTDTRIEVVLKMKQLAIEPGQLSQIDYILKDYFMLVKTERGQFCYRLPTVPMDYWKTNFTEHDVHIQIEADGWIYLIRPDVLLPTKDLSDQPVGFPIAPSAEKDQCLSKLEDPSN